MTTIGLIACGRQKLTSTAEARDLYTSSLFRKASAYATATYDRWFILSAKHGLLAPDQRIAPYDQSLKELSRDQRQEWARSVLAEIEQRHLGCAKYYLHAGMSYSEFLTAPLDAERPLAGLGIGQQLAWYVAHGY